MQRMTMSAPLSMELYNSNIELHMLNYRLKILSIKKKAIHKLMYPIVKVALTNKTKCSFFSFDETNDDFSVVVDNYGFEEMRPYINETDITLSKSDWIPMCLSGEDLPGSMSISKIAKYLILPLADWKISIMAISMYQCDYILIQEKDYDTVLTCLSNHIPKIYDESVSLENEVVLSRPMSAAPTARRSSNNSNLIISPPTPPSSNSRSDSPTTEVAAVSPDMGAAAIGENSNSSSNSSQENNNTNNHKQRQRKITLPLLIPDNTEYCITGLYSMEAFLLIIPTLIEIMFYETDEYGDNEMFFNFTKKETDISIVMESRLLKKFPDGALLSIHTDFWKLIRIGQSPVGFEVFGVCASISQPLELANIDEFYISSFHTGYCFIPSEKLYEAKELFAKRKAKFIDSINKSSSHQQHYHHHHQYEEQQQPSHQPPTFLLSTSAIDQHESNTPSSSSSSSANSDILPVQPDKSGYGVDQDDDENSDCRAENRRAVTAYEDDDDDDDDSNDECDGNDADGDDEEITAATILKDSTYLTTQPTI